MNHLSRLLLLTLVLVIVNCALAREHVEEKIIHHYFDPDPQRLDYIWNPFPGLCGPNATMVKCGGVCPETCKYKSLKCPLYCGVPCKCKSGYVFDETRLKCILQNDCPTDQQPQQQVDVHRVFQ